MQRTANMEPKIDAQHGQPSALNPYSLEQLSYMMIAGVRITDYFDFPQQQEAMYYWDNPTQLHLFTDLGLAACSKSGRE